MRISLDTIITNIQASISCICTNAAKAAKIKILSAIGSISLPKSVTIFFLCAIIPSKKSDKAAKIKIVKLKAFAQRPWQNKKNIKTKVSRILSIVNLLAIFTFNEPITYGSSERAT
jgi:hypothetical protein